MTQADINLARSGMTSKSNPEVRIFESAAEALNAYPQFRSAHAGGIFETLSWFEILVEHGTEHPETARLLVCGDASYAILLPLHIQKGQVSALSNYYASLYGPVIYGNGDLGLAARAIALWLKGQRLNTLNFRPMDLGGGFWVAMQSALRENGFLVDTYFCFANWYLPSSGLRWNEYLAARPSRLKNTITRSRKKLHALADFELAIVCEPGPELDRAIEDYSTVYGRSWKQPEPFPFFIPNLCRTAAANGWLRLGVAKLCGKPAAAQIWFVKDGVASIYKLAYDEAFAKQGVGTVLTAALFEHCLDQDQAREIDFLTGDESYKAEWMSHRREREGLIAFNPMTLHGLLGGGAHFGSRLTTPVLRSTAKLRFGKTDENSNIKSASNRSMQSETIPTSAGTEALVVGLCAHGLSLTRALQRNGVPVFAFEQHNRNPGTWTNSATVIRVADINGDALIQDLVVFAQNRPHKRPVLLLTNDRMTETVARHVDIVRRHFDLSWADCAIEIAALLNKSNIEARCRETGMAYPRSALANSAESVSGLLANLSFPIIIKPTKPLSSFKTLVIEKPEDLHAAIAPHAASAPYLAQEFIPGGDERIFFCALYLHKGKTIAHFEGRKLRSRPMGHTTIAQTCSDPALRAYTEKFFAGLNLSGPVSLEVKRDSNGTMWVIEPTVGRSDFWVGLCIEAGINLPLIEYQAQADIARMRPSERAKPALWINGERDPYAVLWLALHRPTALACRRIAGVYLDISDVLPFLRHAAGAPARFCRGVYNKTIKAFRLFAGA